MNRSLSRTRMFLHRLGSAARQFLALTLIVTLGPSPLLFAQVSAIGQSVGATPMSLHITILDGEDALNSIRERTAREPIVEVDDENHKPVAGALILFTIQGGGETTATGASTVAGASFNGLSSFTATTGADGRAIGHGLLPNKVPGKYTISVTATLGALVVTAIIHQSNVAGLAESPSAENAPPPATEPPTPVKTRTPGKFARIPKKYWITGGTIIVVGTILGVTLTRGNSPTTITAGAGTVGP